VTWPVPRPGLVIRYSYLWESEVRQGREEGTKDRPCAIVLVVLRHGQPNVGRGDRVEPLLGALVDQLRRKMLVDEQLHR
jgi:hypothetical protein